MKQINQKNEILQFLKNQKKRKVFFAIDNLGKDKRKCRCVLDSDTTVFVYAERSKKWGFHFTFDAFSNRYTVLLSDDNAQWQRRMKRAVKLLEESGLWSDIKERYQNVLNSGMTLAERDRMEEIYWTFSPFSQFSNEAIRQAYGEFPDKFPFMFDDNNDIISIDTNYIWEQSHCILKPMYFGKGCNTMYKQEIAQAIKEKRDYSIYRLPVQYDVTFTYKAEKNMAWYSEEYRNCGNGHYYIALNNSTALFCEDD